ncbi:alpha/beta hydrolase [Glaciibacter sp. 2TAF33]|uniref:alpha/beta hydrolase n=1 Tax=Glaciibacter sp. 2TAF33 TaxID=3233015 RepID=UPI003F8FC9B6
MSAVVDVAVHGDRSDLAAGRPLLLLMHGYGSHENDLAGLAPYLPAGFDWVSLRAPIGIAPGGFAWFPISVPGRPDAAPVIAAADAVLQWVRDNVDPETPVVPLGFSQGGLMVTQLLRQAPERFAAGVVLAGFTLDAVLPGDEILAETKPPVFFGRGDADQVISAETTARISAWLPGHSTLTEKVYPGLPHSISGEELADVSEFLVEALQAPAPARP